MSVDQFSFNSQVHLPHVCWNFKFKFYHFLWMIMTVFFSCSVSFKFGIITCVGGIVGVWVGAELARRYRAFNRRADAVVCAFGCLLCTVFLYGTLVVAPINLTVAYVSWTQLLFTVDSRGNISISLKNRFFTLQHPWKTYEILLLSVSEHHEETILYKPCGFLWSTSPLA